MKTKLTLSIEKEVIEEARQVLQSEGQNISRAVEDFLKRIISNKNQTANNDKDAEEYVSKLAGLLKLPEGITPEDAKWEYFKEKYDLKD